MTDQYQPFNDDFDRQFIDSTHPLYVSPASTAPFGHRSVRSDEFDLVTTHTIHRGPGGELGPRGRSLLYGAFALMAAYFGFIMIFGAH